MNEYRTLGEFEIAETLVVEKLLNTQQLEHYLQYVDLSEAYRLQHGEPRTTLEFQREREAILKERPDIQPTMVTLGNYMIRILKAGTDGAMSTAFFQ